MLIIISERHVIFQLVLLLILQMVYAGYIMQRKTFKTKGMTNVIVLNEIISVMKFDMLVIYSGSVYNSGME